MNAAPTTTRQLCRDALRALVVSACFFALVAPGLAQTNPAAQACGEIKDEDTRFQAQLCSAHAGCRMVLGIQKTCTRTVEFLDRLKTSIGDGVQTLFGRRKEVQPENVVDASLGEEARRVAGDPAWKARSDAVDKLTRQASRSELSGSNGQSNWTYVGDVKNGSPDGAGTLFFDSGDVVRGQFKKGIAEGQVDNLSADGMRRIGEVRDKKLNGDGLAITPGGTEIQGQFSQGALNGEGVTKLKDGTRYEGQFSSGTLVDGRAYRADGSLIEKGRFGGNYMLQVGERFDAAGKLTETVDRPRQLAQAEAAKRQAAEDQRLQAEADRQRDETQKKLAEAAAQQAFQDRLGTMNPGQLFALADEMGVAGDGSRARQALRALVSRFPDHALAGTAATQLAKANASSSAPASPAAGGAGKPVGSSGKVSSRYSSVCQRNKEKIDKVLISRKVLNYFATYDLVLRDVQMLLAKIAQPCVNSDAEMADNYRSAMASVDQVNRRCAGSHHKIECTQWGFSNSEANRSWFAVFSAEVNKALSDPNYSVDLDGGATQSVSSNASGDCQSAMQRQESEFQSIQQRISGTQSVVRQSQLLMAMLSMRMAVLDNSCKGQSRYAEYADLQRQFDSTKRACQGMASNPNDCVPAK